MIVEDNPANMRLTSDTLELCGFEVCQATNAKEALEKISQFSPDAILMDIQLPHVDGLTLTKQIKQNDLYKDVIIIAITAFAMQGDKEKILAAGCDDYVAKPANLFEVAELINFHLTKNR